MYIYIQSKSTQIICIYIYVQVECTVSLVVIANISDCDVLIVNCRSSHSGDAIRVMSVGVDHLRERLAHCKILDIPQLVTILIFLRIFFYIFLMFLSRKSSCSRCWHGASKTFGTKNSIQTDVVEELEYKTIDCLHVPSGNLKQLLKIAIYSGFIH